jgi:hypothetical protein
MKEKTLSIYNEEEQFICRTKKDPKDRNIFRVSGIRKPLVVPKKHFDFVDDMPVKNQYQRGSCSSQGGTHHKERQEKIKGSARFGMVQSKLLEGNKKEWGYASLIMKAYHKIGMCVESLLPEPSSSMSWLEYVNPDVITQEMLDSAKEHKSGSYWRINPDANNTIVDTLRRELHEGKSESRTIVLSLKWYLKFNNRYIGKAGVLPDKSQAGRFVGGHLTELVDFDDYKEQFKVKNSYSKHYGDGGFFYIPYSLLPKIMMSAYTSLDLPPKLAVDNRYGEIRTWTSFMRERAFAFNAWLFGQINRLPSNREISALAYGYWDFESVFRGKVGDKWLNMTKPEYQKKYGITN